LETLGNLRQWTKLPSISKVCLLIFSGVSEYYQYSLLFLASSDLNPRKNCSYHVQVYVEGLRTNAVQTAWAMLALIYVGQVLFLITYHLVHMTASLISKQGDVFICNQLSQHLRICKYLDALDSSPKKIARKNLYIMISVY
jgi:hypothetical protein